MSDSSSSAPSGRAGLFDVLWRQKVLVILPVLLSLMVAAVYLATEPKRYEATAQLTVTPAGSRLTADGSDSSPLSNFLYTESEKMLSREILVLALTQPVPDDAEVVGMVGKKIHDLQTFKESDKTALATIKDYAAVFVDKKGDALTVNYESPVRAESPVIVNAIVQAYMKYQTLPKQSTSATVLEAHRNEKQKIETERNGLIAQMSALEQKYGVLSRNGEDNLAFKNLAAVSQRLATAHTETLRAKADQDEAAQLVQHDPRILAPADDSSAAGIVSADDEQLLRANLMQLQTRLHETQVHYLPDHPAVRLMQQKVSQAAAAYAESVKRRLLRAQQIENELNTQYEQQEKRTLEASAQAAHYSHLKDESDRKSKLIETLDTRIYSLELQQAAGGVDIHFFNPADLSATAAQRSHPSKTKTLGLALVLGLMIGCGIAMFRDWMDDRLHSADEIKSSLAMPLLGAIPQMSVSTPPDVMGQKVAMEPHSEVAEAFRSVRTAIQFGAPKDRCKTLLVTSPSAGDGKSVSAANLATAMAQNGKKVLLIDADLRNPTQGLIFGLKESRLGLASLLSGQGTLERTLQAGMVDNLDILPCGQSSKNPTEMLNSPMFGELLESLAERYDHIIIDAPPVMGLADARIIAASCDLTLLVLRADKTTRRTATLARDGLIGVGASVLGAIVNDVSRRSEGFYDSNYRYPANSRPAVEAATAATSSPGGALARRKRDV